jgi:hypothetical protein
MEPHGSIVTQAWITLDRFGERAARIMRTAIAQRDDLDTLGSQILIQINRLGPSKSQIRRERPDEEQIVHAAVVIRPLILQGDPVYHGKVMKALGLLATDATEQWRTQVTNEREAWRQIMTVARWTLQVGATNGEWQTEMRSDRAIAMDWLYADVVHADVQRQEAIKHIPEEDRLMAGLLLVRDGVVYTRSSQNLIRALKEAGALAAHPVTSRHRPAPAVPTEN